MPQEYYSNMLALRSDIQILYKILSIKDPDLLHHLAELSVDMSIITVESFLTLYTNTCHPDITEVILDSVFLHGSVVILKAMVVLLGYLRDDLLATQTISNRS